MMKFQNSLKTLQRIIRSNFLLSRNDQRSNWMYRSVYVECNDVAGVWDLNLYVYRDVQLILRV